MEIEDKLFLLRIGFANRRGDKVNTCSFERLINVRFLREVGHDAVFYDKELNMYFQNTSAIAQVYEIETVDFFVKASGILSKAEEYIRRINYRYDWMQVKVNQSGKVMDILNKEELKERWLRLRTAIFKDYKGDVVEFGLSKIDKQFNDPNEIETCIAQYFYFGLLFPCIPQKHDEDWKNRRDIRFSDYENEIFDENITYTQTAEGNRYYKVTGTAYPDSETFLNCYSGSLCVSKDDTFPESADINIEFERDDIINQWSFDLLRYN